MPKASIILSFDTLAAMLRQVTYLPDFVVVGAWVGTEGLEVHIQGGAIAQGGATFQPAITQVSGTVDVSLLVDGLALATAVIPHLPEDIDEDATRASQDDAGKVTTEASDDIAIAAPQAAQPDQAGIGDDDATDEGGGAFKSLDD